MKRLLLPAFFLLGVPSVQAQPAPVAPVAPRCGPMAAQVFAAGCDGPGVLVCDTGASLPAMSTWCGCDGATHEAPSMAPPTGLRYRFRGACEVPVRFEVTDERSARGGRSGRVVVFAAVGNGTAEVTREPGPCVGAGAPAGALGSLRCGAGRGAVTLVLRRLGDAVVVTRASAPGASLLSLPVSAGQGLRAEPLRRF
jgi:hypothetical protein